MDPATRANSLNVLNNYNFGGLAGEREYLLCIKTENGKKSLEKIKTDEATSWLNNVLKFLGLGPLANCDTSISHIERFVEQLFKSDMKDGAHYVSAAKVAGIASKREHQLMHLFEMSVILKRFPDGIEQEIPLEDLILISKNKNAKDIKKNTPISDLQEMLKLIKTNRELEKDKLNNQDDVEFIQFQIDKNNQAIEELLE